MKQVNFVRLLVSVLLSNIAIIKKWRKNQAREKRCWCCYFCRKEWRCRFFLPLRILVFFILLYIFLIFGAFGICKLLSGLQNNITEISELVYLLVFLLCCTFFIVQSLTPKSFHVIYLFENGNCPFVFIILPQRTWEMIRIDICIHVNGIVEANKQLVLLICSSSWKVFQ